MNWFGKAWEWVVKFRTWLVNGVGTFIVLIAPILGAPEIQAVIPKAYLPYVIAAVFLINIWMRPRPASVKK